MVPRHPDWSLTRPPTYSTGCHPLASSSVITCVCAAESRGNNLVPSPATTVSCVMTRRRSTCINLLRDTLLPSCNQFGYGQVESPYGSGQFIKDLKEHLKDDEQIITSEIRDRDAIIGSIRDFLGKGK